ncbi:deoxy xylulose reductoisomerase1 [Zea mays]|uniref:Deoxy xylulose reductoisomerase1 n=1 Tax=Zea mays TaxID=4577 RepID=A0A1D6MNJ1_MAIZE|nr:deoxy xylulose reductoisomerase1 [Zea mays]
MGWPKAYLDCWFNWFHRNTGKGIYRILMYEICQSITLIDQTIANWCLCICLEPIELVYFACGSFIVVPCNNILILLELVGKSNQHVAHNSLFDVNQHLLPYDKY